MARQCEICGKKPKIVIRRIKLRGKYNPTTKRRQKPNIQPFSLPSGKKVFVCKKCRNKLLEKFGE